MFPKDILLKIAQYAHLEWVADNSEALGKSLISH